ncbi:MAG: hypothetical protein ACP5OG_05285 [Candidatus Nanoarchaeia archaeon]
MQKTFKESEELKAFVIKFFKNINANVNEEKDFLIIEKVPKEFEDFYGQKSPYKFSFGSNEKNPEFETISRSSLLLRTINNYLESQGQTTLLRIDFALPEEEIKKYLVFRNCEVYKTAKKKENKPIIKFTFSTSLQYLNEKEQILNNIYTDNEKIIDFNIENYSTSDGKKDEVSVENIKSLYILAKEKLKETTNEKIQDIGKNLALKLEKEISRINEHYAKQTSEINQEIKKNEEQLISLENNIQKIKQEERPIIEQKIKRIKEILDSLEKNKKTKEFENEKQFFINDEIHKHSLNIQNKLINTAIIYYPIYSLDLTLKNPDTIRIIDIKFNPLKKEVASVSCDSCSKELREIVLCTSGHITCSKCGKYCSNCHRIICPKCTLNKCSICHTEACKKCITKCNKCNKYVCKSHLKKDSINSREYCSSCLKNCSICSKPALKEYLHKCPECSIDICEKCIKTSIIKTPSKTLCIKCSKKCSSCLKISSKNEFKTCIGCDYKECTHLNKCLSCRKQICSRLKRKT